jgi:hypothetical protein
MYIEKLPLVVPDVSYEYDSCKIARAVYNDLVSCLLLYCFLRVTHGWMVHDVEDVPCPRMWLTLEKGV